MLGFSKNYVQDYVMKFGLLLRKGFLVDVVAITLQSIVGCLLVLVRAGLRVACVAEMAASGKYDISLAYDILSRPV